MIELELDTARKVFEVNCLAALCWVQQANRAWMGRCGGAIVNISSVAGLKPTPGIDFYGASKAMLSYITAELAAELGSGVRVNAVVKTEFATALYSHPKDRRVDPGQSDPGSRRRRPQSGFPARRSIRTLRFADGPDEVHKSALARAELRHQTKGA